MARKKRAGIDIAGGVRKWLLKALKTALDQVSSRENFYAVAEDVEDGTIIVHEGKNTVQTTGLTYYAQKTAEESPTNFVDGADAFDGIFELGTAGNAPAVGSDRSDLTTKTSTSQKAMDSGYPQTNDSDTDNPGTTDALTITYRVSYGTSEANDTSIDRMIITNPSPGASEATLMYGTFASSFDKTTSQTLKVYVNHTFANA